MAAHSSVLAWRIPGTGEPGGLLSMGSVAQSRTRLKRLSSSSSSSIIWARDWQTSSAGDQRIDILVTVMPCSLSSAVIVLE